MPGIRGDTDRRSPTTVSNVPSEERRRTSKQINQLSWATDASDCNLCDSLAVLRRMA